MKIVRESLNEISRELVNRAASKMEDKDQLSRASRLLRNYDKTQFAEFLRLPIFDDEIIYNISYETINKYEKPVNLLSISYGSPPSKEFNRSQGHVQYNIDLDQYDAPIMSRKDARILAKIATKVNPNTKYNNGAGDLKIKGY